MAAAGLVPQIGAFVMLLRPPKSNQILSKLNNFDISKMQKLQIIEKLIVMEIRNMPTNRTELICHYQIDLHTERIESHMNGMSVAT